VSNPWLKLLADAGGKVDDGFVRDFGDPRGEIAATAHGDVVADLSHLGVLAITGADAAAFLHGQLSCDVEGLPDGRATYGCYCTPKGRVLANFLLWREPDGFRMLLPRSLSASVHKRLQKFVLRSKVMLTDGAADYVALGLSGHGAFDAATSVVAPISHTELQVARRDGITAITVPGPRALIVAPLREGPTLWERLTRMLKPVGATCWGWLDIVNGLPWIGPSTQEEFVPQMANLELIGAINFQKGCYPGQEIVARTQYLGKPKRRLGLAHVRGDQMPAEGEPLMSGSGDQSAGIVVNAAPAPEGGFDLLAVVQVAAVASSALHIASQNGPVLEFRPLPYLVP